MIQKKRTVALIPARGGSKGIPNKNIADLAGRPLITYAISAALESNVDDVWVSTDCLNIEEVAADAGAKIVRRPDSLSEDDTNSEDVLLHFAECVPDFDTLVFMQCTSPLTLPEDIEGGLDVLNYNPYDSVLSVCLDHGGWLCGGFNWVYEKNGASRVNLYYHQRQESPDSYRENGAFYITTKGLLEASKSRVAGNIGLYVMPRQRSFEVDTPEDLKEMDYLLTHARPSPFESA